MHGISDTGGGAAADHDFPALHRFFGAYFHQDWHAEHGSSTAAIEAYRHDAPPATMAVATAELDRVLAMDLDDASLGRLLRQGFDCNYVPEADELTNRAWLERIRGLLQPANPV